MSARSSLTRRSAPAGESLRAWLDRGLVAAGLLKEEREGGRLVGLDVARESSRLQQRPLLPILLLLLLGALLLAYLRIDLIRMRYTAAETMRVEQELFDRQRALMVQMQQRRDPARIAERAREMGFVRPERVIDLPPAAALAIPSNATEESAAAAAAGSAVRP